MTLLGEVKVHWQAEHSVTLADGGIHLELSTGEIVWLPPLEVLQAISGPLLPGASGGAVLPLQDILSGVLLQNEGSGFWIGESSNGPPLAGLVRDFLNIQAEILGPVTDTQVLAALASLGPGQTVVADNFVFHLTGDLTPPAPTGSSASGGPVTAMAASFDVQLVHELHEMLLGRPPSESDLALWVQQLGSGALGPDQLAHALAALPEAQALHAGQGDAAYVSSLYRAALDQDPDAATLVHWTTLLSTHVLDRGELALRVAQEAIGAHPAGGDLLGLH